jgi:protein-disulfide isomerase
MNTHEEPRWKTALEAAALVLQIAVLLVIGAASYAVWSTHSITVSSQSATPPASSERPVPPAEPLSIAGSPTLGRPSAKVVLVEFSDFECPFCGEFARDTLPQIAREYIDAGKVSLALKFLPLERIHKFALSAAQAVDCAGAQDRLWQMHDAVFADQRRLDKESFLARADSLRLDNGQYGKCLDGQVSDRIQRDIADAKALGIRSTPTFLVGSLLPDGRVRVVGRASRALKFADFKLEFDKILAQ